MKSEAIRKCRFKYKPPPNTISPSLLSPPLLLLSLWPLSSLPASLNGRRRTTTQTEFFLPILLQPSFGTIFPNWVQRLLFGGIASPKGACWTSMGPEVVEAETEAEWGNLYCPPVFPTSCGIACLQTCLLAWFPLRLRKKKASKGQRYAKRYLIWRLYSLEEFSSCAEKVRRSFLLNIFTYIEPRCM